WGISLQVYRSKRSIIRRIRNALPTCVIISQGVLFREKTVARVLCRPHACALILTTERQQASRGAGVYDGEAGEQKTSRNAAAIAVYRSGSREGLYGREKHSESPRAAALLLLVQPRRPSRPARLLYLRSRGPLRCLPERSHFCGADDEARQNARANSRSH